MSAQAMVEGALPTAPSEIRIETTEGETILRRTPLGFFTVWPLPTRHELESLYRHEYYVTDKPVYIEKTRQELPYWQGIWELRRQLMVGVLGTERGRLLDVGSSAGFLLDYFRSAGWEVAGVEPSRQAAGYARRELGLEVFSGFLDDFECERPFDAVHCSLVLEHVLDPDRFVERLAGLLRPGGVLFVEVPNDFNPLQEVIRTELGKPAWWVVPAHHLNYFDFESLSRLLAHHGLAEVDRLGSFPMELFPLMGKDYVGDDAVGLDCHAMRMGLEKAVLASPRSPLLSDLYRALGGIGLGRTCNLLAVRGS